MTAKGDAPRPPTAPRPALEELVCRIVLEVVDAASGRLGEADAAAIGVEVGRRVGEALGEQGGAPGRGEEAADGPRPLAEADPAGAEGAGPREPAQWDDVAKAARKAAHDLNQPLTVILGYATILKRTESEALRMEAAERIIGEARKMSGIIGRLSRLAKGLDAA